MPRICRTRQPPGTLERPILRLRGCVKAKLDFLNKAISVTCFALGETIDVSAARP